jgi:hypothetical protein
MNSVTGKLILPISVKVLSFIYIEFSIKKLEETLKKQFAIENSHV